jgi:hypothetical protein
MAASTLPTYCGKIPGPNVVNRSSDLSLYNSGFFSTAPVSALVTCAA